MDGRSPVLYAVTCVAHYALLTYIYLPINSLRTLFLSHLGKVELYLLQRHYYSKTHFPFFTLSGFLITFFSVFHL